MRLLPGHSVQIRLLAAALVMFAFSAQAGPKQPPTLQLIGDGAAECAAAKKAAAHARATHGREAFSIASANLDATFYHLDLFLGMDDDSISGTVRVEGRVVNSALSTLTLDLAPSMLVTTVTLPDATPLAFTHPGSALNITLPSAQAVGTPVAVLITYRGMPVSNGLGNFVFGSRMNGKRFAWSLSEPYGAREWWPCKDHPADKADSVRVTVTVPSQYRVGSQGILVSQTTIGPNTTHDWRSRYPISSYLVSVAIGEYVQHNELYVRPGFLETDYGPLSMPLIHLRYNDATPDLPTGWAATADVMEVEESWFGPYPFADEKYGHSEFTFGGGMEHQTMTSLGSSAVSVVAHELSHQWYGDSVTPKHWRDLWLNEGFATYAELIFFKERESTYPGFYDAVLDARLSSARRAEGTLVLEDTTSVNNMFDGFRVYAKGAMVLYMLHYVTGETVFKNILKAWAADPAVQYGNAETADFQRVAETVSGLDLDSFFRQWVTHGTGYPTYAASSTWLATGGGYQVWTTIAQTQTQPQSNVGVFDMPVEIVVYTQSADTLMEIHRERVQNNARSQVFELDVASKPAKVRIDPDVRILRSEQISGTSQPLPPYPAISAIGPNPTAGDLKIQYQLDRGSRVEIKVYDIAGRRVLTDRFDSSAGMQFRQLDTTGLASGVYFLRFSTPQGRAQSRFVVVR